MLGIHYIPLDLGLIALHHRGYLPGSMWLFTLALPLSPAGPEQGGQVFVLLAHLQSSPCTGNRFPPVSLAVALLAQAAGRVPAKSLFHG